MDRENGSATLTKTTELKKAINMQLVQNILLIWLDNDISKNTPDCQNTIAQLRRVVNLIKTFTDSKECIDFLHSITDEKICMIISGGLGQHIVPQIHDLASVDTIFIFCGNKQYHDIWAKNWVKIKGVFTDIMRICDVLKKTTEQYEQDSISMSFIPTNVTSVENQIDPSFICRTVLKEILLTMKFDEGQIRKYFEFCRNIFVDNDQELQNITKFEQERNQMSPISWYNYKCFLYPMLNRGLQVFDVDIIIHMGFFITDLQQQIIDLHKEQFVTGKPNRQFVVYRGQGMTKTQFNKLQQTKGGLLSFNNFLSTSKNYEVSMPFARNGATNPNNVGVLFVMTIRPDQVTSPFASIGHINGYHSDEHEVLFGINSIFHINDVKPMSADNPNVFKVKLTLPNDNDQDLETVNNRIRQEDFPNQTGWYRLALVLQHMNRFNKAQRIYEILLEQTKENHEKAPLYGELGNIKFQQGEYKDAIGFYEKALAIKQQILSTNHPSLTISYSNIGLAYFNMNEYTEAFSYYNKALSIDQQSLPANHPDLATSYHNVGNAYFYMEEYTKALSYYERTLSIDQQSLPANHPDLAASYNNIGNVYYKKAEYAKALSYYEKSLAIRQQSLPPSHPDLASSYNNIGLVHFNTTEYAKALSYYEKSLAIRQQSLSPKHPDLANSYKNIGHTHLNKGEYTQALSYYEKSLAILEQSTSRYNNIGLQYRNMCEHVKTLSTNNNIGRVFQNMNEYSKRLSSQPDLAIRHNTIRTAYEMMRKYSHIYSLFEQMSDFGSYAKQFW